MTGLAWGRSTISRVGGDKAPLDGASQRGVEQRMVPTDRGVGQPPLAEALIKRIELASREPVKSDGANGRLDVLVGHPAVLPQRVGRSVWSDVVEPPVEQLAYAHRVTRDEPPTIYVGNEVCQRALGRPLATNHGTADPADLAVWLM